VACHTQSYPAAERNNGTLGVAGAQWVHTAEYGGEYDVPVQAAVRGTALGAEARHATRRSAVINRMTQLGMSEAVGRECSRAFPESNYL
jgi:hypothetical protein